MRPSVRLLAGTQLEPDFAEEVGNPNPLKLVEFAGRWDYGAKSIAKMDPDDLSIIRRWIDQGEQSMLELVHAVFFIICSRVVTHELVRHRIASYQQESQRFVAYEDESDDDLFYVPNPLAGDSDVMARFRESLARSLSEYKLLRRLGVSKQLARYVLPNATRARIIVDMNLRQWRHVLGLRLHSSAQPEMREVMLDIRTILADRYPQVFEDVTGAERAVR
jgi:thymidylate synthase (FAD)